MAKGKRITKNESEIIINEPKTEIQPMAKDKKVEDTKIVIGVTEAEELQKQGWQLISVTQTSDGKVFKFKKGN